MFQNFIIKNLGMCNYTTTWKQMQEFTDNRSENTADEFWILEHPPVFTLGLAGKKEHIINIEHDIPIIHCDRGGQVTYHGPGQVIVYMLIDIKRIDLSIRELVTRIENGVINYLTSYDLIANGDRNAPGVYINSKKIASMGLKVRKGCTYHGLSFNVKMDTTPFNYINVCGYANLKVIQLHELKPVNSVQDVAHELIKYLTTSIYKEIS